MTKHFDEMHHDLSREATQRYIPVTDEFLNEHQEARFFKMQRCSFPGCDNEKYFKHFGQYLSHAEKKHNLSGKDAVVVFVMENPPRPLGQE